MMGQTIDYQASQVVKIIENAVNQVETADTFKNNLIEAKRKDAGTLEVTLRSCMHYDKKLVEMSLKEVFPQYDCVYTDLWTILITPCGGTFGFLSSLEGLLPGIFLLRKFFFTRKELANNQLFFQKNMKSNLKLGYHYQRKYTYSQDSLELRDSDSKGHSLLGFSNLGWRALNWLFIPTTATKSGTNVLGHLFFYTLSCESGIQPLGVGLAEINLGKKPLYEQNTRLDELLSSTNSSLTKSTLSHLYGTCGET